MTGQVEARCDHCGQMRVLFRYEPMHSLHFTGSGFAGCRWCARSEQPLLCVRCWDIERQCEEDDPVLDQEAGVLVRIVEQNQRAAAARARDRETCDGIAAVTDRSYT